jgi:hypothetical protein
LCAFTAQEKQPPFEFFHLFFLKMSNASVRARAMFKDENALVAMIADEVSVCRTFCCVTYKLQDTITGFLLAGVGHKDKKRQENFLVVDNSMISFYPLNIGY